MHWIIKSTTDDNRLSESRWSDSGWACLLAGRMRLKCCKAGRTQPDCPDTYVPVRSSRGSANAKVWAQIESAVGSAMPWAAARAALAAQPEHMLKRHARGSSHSTLTCGVRV